MTETVNAKKRTMSEKDALALVEGAREIYVAKGKNVTHLDLTSKPSKSEILALILGPTGNLRAPTVRIGKTLLVGFTEELYAKFIGRR